MELELGLKLTRVADEFISDFQISKDRAGPLFVSRETDTMFILTAHLHGYKRGNIKIDINVDGTLITISGERQVKETTMVDWKVYTKDTETQAFKKVFKIPDTVNLDKIKAKYNDDESTLTISMPKKVKGIQGIAVEEVKEVAELAREGSGNLQILDEKDQKNETSDQENDEIRKSGRQQDSGENKITQEQMPRKETESVLESGGGDRLSREGSGNLQILDEKDQKNETSDQENDEIRKSGRQQDSGENEITQEQMRRKETESVLESGGDWLRDEVHENSFHGQEMTEETKCSPSKKSEVPYEETEIPKQEFVNENTDDTRKITEPELDHAEPLGKMQVNNEAQNENDQIQEKESERNTQEEEAQEAEAEAGRGEEGEPKQRSKRCKMCTPIVAAGSAILLSFVVFVFDIIRSKNQASKRKD